MKEIATGTVPYSYINKEGGIMFAILHQKPPYKSLVSRNGAPVETEIRQLCHKCIDVDPYARPTMKAIVSVIDRLCSVSICQA